MESGELGETENHREQLRRLSRETLRMAKDGRGNVDAGFGVTCWRLFGVQPMNILIALSQLTNAMIGGSPYEMLCSRAWRLRANTVWGVVQCVIDHWSPFAFWRTETMTHCQWCYVSESKRCECLNEVKHANDN
jgi:hypothetical protein